MAVAIFSAQAVKPRFASNGEWSEGGSARTGPKLRALLSPDLL